MRVIPLLCVLSLAAASAHALPTVDGVMAAGEYGPAVAVQTVETGFGDNFSELDAAYATVEGGTLYLMLTGNLEANFNKLNIFIDSQAGGQNVIETFNNPTNDGWAGKYGGFTFDAGFAPDSLIILRNGVFGTPQFNFDFTVIGGGATDFDAATSVFGNSLTGAGTVVGTFGTFQVGFDNGNAAGIAGGSGAANAAAALAVTTGIELGIPLSALGNPVGSLRVSAMISGSGHDYLSNQFLGGLAAPQVNLGGDGSGGFNGTVGLLDLNDFGGDQHFEVVAPEASTPALMGLGLLGLARSRRA